VTTPDPMDKLVEVAEQIAGGNYEAAKTLFTVVLQAVSP